MNSAIIHRLSGDLDKAERLAFEARRNAGTVGRVLLGNIQTFQASIARDRGEYRQAVEHYRESIKTHGEAAPLDVAYNVVELCRLQFEAGNSLAAYKTARTLLPLMERLEKNPLSASYVTELLRCAVAGSGLTTTLLDRVARSLKCGRTELYGHARPRIPPKSSASRN